MGSGFVDADTNNAVDSNKAIETKSTRVFDRGLIDSAPDDADGADWVEPTAGVPLLAGVSVDVPEDVTAISSAICLPHMVELTWRS